MMQQVTVIPGIELIAIKFETPRELTSRACIRSMAAKHFRTSRCAESGWFAVKFCEKATDRICVPIRFFPAVYSEAAPESPRRSRQVGAISTVLASLLSVPAGTLTSEITQRRMHQRGERFQPVQQAVLETMCPVIVAMIAIGDDGRLFQQTAATEDIEAPSQQSVGDSARAAYEILEVAAYGVSARSVTICGTRFQI